MQLIEGLEKEGDTTEEEIEASAGFRRATALRSQVVALHKRGEDGEVVRVEGSSGAFYRAERGAEGARLRRWRRAPVGGGHQWLGGGGVAVSGRGDDGAALGNARRTLKDRLGDQRGGE
jgi:hypothetical protein